MAIQETMPAWRVHQYGGFRDVLRLGSCTLQLPENSHTTIRVAAIGLNYLDILSIAGKYQEKGPLPFVPGVEAAGHVVDTSPESPFQVGDKVMTVGSAACAGYMPAAPDTTFPIPGDMSFPAAAAFQLTYQTAYMALVRRARLQPDDYLLVNAGAGGVGTAAIQIGRALGARVIATAGSNEKLSVCRDAGAELAINYCTENVVACILEVTNGRGADVIFDPVGGDIFEESTRCVAFEGRIVVIGFASGRIPSIAANRILLKNIDVIGLFWGNYRQFDFKAIEQSQAGLYDLWDAGKINPVVYKTFAFESLPLALAELAERKSYGKVVVNGPVGGEYT